MIRLLISLAAGITTYVVVPMLVGAPDRNDPNDWRWMATDFGGTIVTLLVAGYFYLGSGQKDDDE